MKLNKLWASALALLSLTACNKDMEPSQEMGSPTEPKTKVVDIVLTADQDQDDLRAIFGIESPLTGALSGLQMSDNDVELRVAVRRGNGEPEIQDLTFKKIKGNRAVYNGPIRIPNEGEGKYQIAALLTRELGAGAEPPFFKAKAVPNQHLMDIQGPTVLVPHTGNTLKINIPYVSEWQDVTLSDAGKIEYAKLEMKPFGTILRIRIKNEGATEKTFHSINFASNAFVHNGYFSFHQEEGNKPKFFPSNIEHTSRKIEGGVTVPGHQDGEEAKCSPWMYIWLLPRSGTQLKPLNTAAYLLTSENPDHSVPYKAFSTKAPLPTGSVAMTLVYSDGPQASFDDVWEQPQEWGTTVEFKSPLHYISQFPLNQGGDAFIDDNSPFSLAVGRFDYDHAKQFKTVRQVGDGRYSLPSREELLGIFPSATNSSGYSMINLSDGKIIRDVIEKDIQLGENIKGAFKADYLKDRPSNTLFGIRFKGGDNRYCTAFRYRRMLVDNQSKTEYNLIIESTYIGSEEVVSLETIKSNDFWTNRPVSGPKAIVSRRFPMYGSSIRGSVSGQNFSMFIWSSSMQDENGAYSVWLDPTNMRAFVNLSSTLWTNPVYLWKRD